MKRAMNLTFNKITKYEPGIICDLLLTSYSEILDKNLQEQFRQFDREVFENPDTVGACTSITILNSEIVGMASFDPRQAPKLGVIGHNCILPKHQGNGFGKQQIIEILNRLKTRNIRCAAATTSENPFFIPAQRMYLSCGFTEVKTERKNPNDLYKTIYYESKQPRVKTRGIAASGFTRPTTSDNFIYGFSPVELRQNIKIKKQRKEK